MDISEMDITDQIIKSVNEGIAQAGANHLVVVISRARLLSLVNDLNESLRREANLTEALRAQTVDDSREGRNQIQGLKADVLIIDDIEDDNYHG